MIKSDSLKELASALSKAQGQIGSAKKDSENPFFKSKYASLESVINTCKDILSQNGLSVSQLLESEGPDTFVRTTLLHSSGEFLSSSMRLIVSKHDMQALGSAISYARRYALMAAVGIAAEDDDAESTKHFDAPTSEVEKKSHSQSRSVAAVSHGTTTTKAPTESTSSQPTNPGDYEIKGGEWIGQTIRDVYDKFEGESKLKSKIKLFAKPLGWQKPFVENAQAFLNSMSEHKPERPLPNEVKEAMAAFKQQAPPLDEPWPENM